MNETTSLVQVPRVDGVLDRTSPGPPWSGGPCPPQLLQVVSRFLAYRPGVEGAHLGWIVRDDGRAGYLIVVVADDADAAMAGYGPVQVGPADGRRLLVVFDPAFDVRRRRRFGRRSPGSYRKDVCLGEDRSV